MRSLHRKLQKTKFNLRLGGKTKRSFQYYLQQLNKKSGGPTIYYDPSNFSTLYQNTSGTTPVTVVEQPVGVMLNQLGDNKFSVRLDNVANTGLGLAANSNLNLTGDFSIECFIRIRALPTTNAWQTSAGGYQGIWSTGANGSGNGATFFFGTTNIVYSTPNDSTVVINTPHNFQTNVWHHVALTREGQVYRLFIDGVLKQQVTSAAATYLNEKWGIARGEPVGYFSGGWLNGDISNFRAIKGTAVYTSNFAVPTQNLEPIPGTVILCCGVQWSGNPVIEQGVSTYIIQETPFGNGDGTFAVAIPGNNTSLPTVSRRINLITKTNDFANTVWSKYNISTSGNVITSTNTSTSIAHPLFQQLTNTPYIVEIKINPSLSSAPYLGLALSDRKAHASGLCLNLSDLSLSTWAVGNATVAGTYISPLPDADGYYTVWAECESSTWADAPCFEFSPLNVPTMGNGSAANQTVCVKDPSAVFKCFAELPYQWVNTATDYDGDPLKFPTFFRIDGANDGMRTGTVDLSDFNKVFVSMAMAKLSNSAGSIIQAGSDGGVTDGSFALTSNERSLEQYAFKSKGTIASAIANTNSNNAAPHAGVITASADIEANAMSLDII